jgi:ectonucleotide pyrophosphatase/phosphodiesterase family protein 5
MIRTIDTRMGYLVDELKKEAIYSDIDIIIVSDHGMETITRERIINTTTFSDSSLYTNYGSTPVYQIKIHDPSNIPRVYEDFSKEAETRNFSVFKREDLGHFNFTNNRRIQDIVLIADPTYAFEDNERYLNEKGVSGVHGYDNGWPNMRAFFMAKGPSFKQGFVSESPINNIDIVPLICNILGLPEPPNNGSFEHSLNLLREKDDSDSGARDNNRSWYGLILFVLMLILGIN